MERPFPQPTLDRAAVDRRLLRLAARRGLMRPLPPATGARRDVLYWLRTHRRLPTDAEWAEILGERPAAGEKVVKADEADGPCACPRCGSWRTAFTQAQTRSADEGMTTFFACRACSHRWRGE